MTAPRHRCGIMLAEMMFAIALLVIFAASATVLLRTTMRLTWQAEAQEDQVLQFESVLQALRQDVWNASYIEAAQGAVVLRSGDAASVRWTSDGDGIVRAVETNNAGQGVRRWTITGLRINLKPQPGGLLVDLLDDREAVVESAHLASQLMILRAEETP